MKPHLAFLVPLVAAALLLSGCLGNGDDDDDKERTVDIQRTFSTPEGGDAITAAEELDYESLLNLTRYEPRHNDPQFIDSDVIAKYAARTDGDLIYHTEAVHYKMGTLALADKNGVLEISIDTAKASTAPANFLDIDQMSVVTIEDGAVNRTQALNITSGGSWTLSLQDHYTVEMEFTWGKENNGFGYGHEMYQFVVLDSALEPVLLVHLQTQTWQSEGFA